MTNSNNMI